MYKYGVYVFKDEDGEELPKTEIKVYPRYEGTYNVTIENLPFNEKASAFLHWMAMVDVWNLSGKQYGSNKYEFPKEMKDFLYGKSFDALVWRFLGDKANITKY
jgi:hypothetical protein